jgi:hypothetical protein
VTRVVAPEAVSHCFADSPLFLVKTFINASKLALTISAYHKDIFPQTPAHYLVECKLAITHLFGVALSDFIAISLFSPCQKLGPLFLLAIIHALGLAAMPVSSIYVNPSSHCSQDMNAIVSDSPNFLLLSFLVGTGHKNV